MLNFLGGTQIFLAAGATDLRKSFDTLAGVVRGQMGGNPLSGHLYIFCNRGRNRIKILFWDYIFLLKVETLQKQHLKELQQQKGELSLVTACPKSIKEFI